MSAPPDDSAALLDLGPAVETPLRWSARKRYVARLYWLTGGGELACSDSAPMTATTAKRWASRVRRSDVLDAEWYVADELPPPPAWARRIDRLPATLLVEVWRDTLW